MIRSKITNLRKEKEYLEFESDRLGEIVRDYSWAWLLGPFNLMVSREDLASFKSKIRRNSTSIDEISNQLTAQVKARESIESSISVERSHMEYRKKIISTMESDIQGRVLSLNHSDHSRYPCNDIIKP